MSPDQTIGHYRIVSKLGEGGMGAVYRATDTKLNRDVAIKILPPAFADDAARMARFEREARVLASLNHPNIAAIYGIEQGAIVMELVEGADLAGPLPVETAIAYAKQIAAGLEAAHEKGIVHRDLKPANIRVTPEGAVKLLDFGLAKPTEPSAAATGASPTMSPTLSMSMTQAGMILGTAAYMSPEQARGYPVDRRADIWAFGVILFELLAGKHLYGGGATVADTLAAVVLKEPDFAALPAETPPRVRKLIERCLRKDPKQRLRDIGDARLTLDEAEPEAPAPSSPPAASRAWIPWSVVGVLALAVVAAGAAWLRPKAADPGPGVARFVVPLPPGTSLPPANIATQWAPSPDGRNLALIASDGDGATAPWLRPLGDTAAHRLDKTEGAFYPFWSPDGQFIGFFADEKLKRVAVSGGAVQTICEVHAEYRATSGDGAAWGPDGAIVFANGEGPLMRTPAMGGMPQPATTLEKGELSHSWPQFLPDGRHVLYFARNTDRANNAIWVQELGSARRVRVMGNLTRAMWAPPGYLLFVREKTLFAQRMNPKTFQLEGEALAVAQQVMANDGNGRSTFAVSQNGVLVYRTGQAGEIKQLAWRDREGKLLGEVGKPGAFYNPALSPDEKSVAVQMEANGLLTLVMDLASGVLSPMTRDSATHIFGPAWSPDSQRLAVSLSGGGIQEIAVGSAKVTALGNEASWAEDWTPDGSSILCNDSSGTRLSLLSVADGSKLQMILDTPYRKDSFRFTPDGKYVAYVSYESGQPEIYVAAFPSFAPKRKVSGSGGFNPVWAKATRELFYWSADLTMTAAEVRTGATIEVGIPKALFKSEAGAIGNRFAVTADGKRFLLNEPVQKTEVDRPEINLVLNWMAEIHRQ